VAGGIKATILSFCPGGTMFTHASCVIIKEELCQTCSLAASCASDMAKCSSGKEPRKKVKAN